MKTQNKLLTSPDLIEDLKKILNHFQNDTDLKKIYHSSDSLKDFSKISPFCLNFGHQLAEKLKEESLDRITAYSDELNLMILNSHLIVDKHNNIRNTPSIKNIKSLKYLNAFPGTNSCFLASPQGVVFAHKLSTLHAENNLQEIARKASCVMDSLRLEMPECVEVRIDLEYTALYVRYLSSKMILVVMADREADLAGIRIASNMVVQELNDLKEYQLSHMNQEVTQCESKKSNHVDETAEIYQEFDVSLRRDMALKKFSINAA